MSWQDAFIVIVIAQTLNAYNSADFKIYRLHNAAELETCHTVSANVIIQRRRIHSLDILNGEWYGETEHCLILCEKKSEMQALHPHDLFMSSLLKIALVQL